MNRLTRKIKGYYSVDLRTCLPMEYEQIENSNACVDKLGKLEDIEDELGIDLTTLFMALKDGFYIKYNGEIIHIFSDKHITINFWYKIINVFIPPKFFIDCKKGANYLSETIDEEYWFKDYGKTWALTKEELEQ